MNLSRFTPASEYHSNCCYASHIFYIFLYLFQFACFCNFKFSTNAYIFTVYEVYIVRVIQRSIYCRNILCLRIWFAFQITRRQNNWHSRYTRGWYAFECSLALLLTMRPRRLFIIPAKVGDGFFSALFPKSRVHERYASLFLGRWVASRRKKTTTASTRWNDRALRTTYLRSTINFEQRRNEI